jgi:hypothetical protein
LTVVVDRILVAGLPRSGTTLMGSLLAIDPSYRELWEPFNSACRRGVDDYWPYLGPSTPADKRERYERVIDETIAVRGVRGHPIGHRSRSALRRRLGLVVRTSRVDLRYRAMCARERLSPRPGRIVKDPIATFLAEDLATRCGFAVLGCIRHPAAQFLSLRRQGWRPDGMEQLVAQPDAVADLFEPGELEAYESSDDVGFRFGLRYRVLYRYLTRVVAESAAQGSRMVVHEELVADPAGVVTRVAEGLGIDPAPIRARAVELTDGSRQEHGSADYARVLARDARHAAEAWRSELDTDLVASILRGAGDVGAHVT